MILALKNDQPEAALYLLKNDAVVAKKTWHAHRELSNTLLEQIEDMLNQQHATLKDLGGLVVFEGPGSFTGLRIGITVLNTLAYTLNIPVVGETGDDWLESGVKNIKTAKLGVFVEPQYGASAHITMPRK